MNIAMILTLVTKEKHEMLEAEVVNTISTTIYTSNKSIFASSTGIS
jgi:mannose/fructose-specific phosphotransferase system component IIA